MWQDVAGLPASEQRAQQGGHEHLFPLDSPGRTRTHRTSSGNLGLPAARLDPSPLLARSPVRSLFGGGGCVSAPAASSRPPCDGQAEGQAGGVGVVCGLWPGSLSNGGEGGYRECSRGDDRHAMAPSPGLHRSTRQCPPFPPSRRAGRRQTRPRRGPGVAARGACPARSLWVDLADGRADRGVASHAPMRSHTSRRAFGAPPPPAPRALKPLTQVHHLDAGRGAGARQVAPQGVHRVQQLVVEEAVLEKQRAGSRGGTPYDIYDTLWKRLRAPPVHSSSQPQGF